MVTISSALFALLGFLLAALGSVVTVAVAWGAVRTKVEAFGEKLGEVRAEVKELRASVGALDTKVDALNADVVRVTARADVVEKTGGHRPLVIPPGK